MNIREQLRAHETVGRDDPRDADNAVKLRILAAAAVLVSARSTSTCGSTSSGTPTSSGPHPW